MAAPDAREWTAEARAADLARTIRSPGAPPGLGTAAVADLAGALALWHWPRVLAAHAADPGGRVLLRYIGPRPSGLAEALAKVEEDDGGPPAAVASPACVAPRPAGPAGRPRDLDRWADEAPAGSFAVLVGTPMGWTVLHRPRPEASP